MTTNQKFSERQGYSEEEPEITIREDAPEDLRWFILEAGKIAELKPSELRNIICRVLMTAPDPGNWTEDTNIWNEIQDLIRTCEWFKVYDIIEEIYKILAKNGYIYSISTEAKSTIFADEINKFFRLKGIGWQLIDGIIEIRGNVTFEHTVRNAIESLEESNRTTAKKELHEALKDISRRPTPDITGAIQHSMTALECVAREINGEPSATLGQIIKIHPDIVPRPLDICLEKAWGYASEMGRHIREGREPEMEEAELLIGISASIIKYLVDKFI